MYQGDDPTIAFDLLMKGADIQITDKYGKTALYYGYFNYLVY